MNKKTVIGLKYTCLRCNVAFVETVLSDNKVIKNNHYMCTRCGEMLYTEIIRVNSKVIDEQDYQRLCDYDKEKTNV